jgi:predicted amidohydrolase
MKETITAACGQFQPVFGDTNINLATIQRLTEEADADLIVFPELCTSGYEFKDRHEVEALALDLEKGDEVVWLKELAADSGTIVILGLPERSGKCIFNGSAMIEPSGRVTRYHKLHLFDREKNLFDPGDAVPSVVETEAGRIGMMICFDWIFPETTRLLALAGAQIICHPSNLVLQYCQKAMFARSVENGVFTMTCNRIGSESRTDRTLTFTGASQILSNRGATLAQAGTTTEEVITAEIKPGEADNKMITGLNDLMGDRRAGMYGGLCC